MAYHSTASSNILPIFVLEKWVQDATVFDICLAAEKVSGPSTIEGATCIAGLWRVYPKSELTRVKLLSNGVSLKGKTVRFESFNPFIRKGDGNEGQGTRLTVSNLPFSYSNDAVSRNLIAAGFKLRSNIMFEKARGPDGKLTDWKTGRRFVWIDLPKGEVKRSLKMGTFTAYIFFREMRDNMQCRRCLQNGHKAVNCQNEEVCLTCKKAGHRRGDPICSLESTENEGKVQSESENHSTSDGEEVLSEGSSLMSDKEESEVSDDDEMEDDVETTEMSGESRKNDEVHNEAAANGEEVDESPSHNEGKKTEEKETKASASGKSKIENIDVGNSSANYIHLGKGKNDGAKKGKNKDKQKSKASGGKGQSSMDSFVSKDGKRPVGEILSPNDGKSGSPDQRKFKLDK